MTILLGGEACPLGLSVQFIEAPEDEVVASFPGEFANAARSSTGRPLPQALEAMLPFQAPWTRMLTASVGPWTAVTNNFINGGDPTAPGHAVANALGARCVVATHAPRYGPGHATTQLEVFGPEGEPPLMYIRSLAAHATDGRWIWHESGTPLAFEETGRYTARRKRDRFDRAMLLRYLTALGIAVEDNAYGEATLHQGRRWPGTREVTLEEERANFALKHA